VVHTLTPRARRAALSRRTLLRATGAGVVAVTGGGLLAACSEEAGSEGAATEIDKIAGVLPTYQELTLDLPAPDVPGTPPMVPNGYTSYPSRLVDAITDTPGSSGQTIKAMTPFWGPPPPGLGDNSYLAAVNEQLGVDVDFSIQDGNSYADKLNAILGARDVPDVLCIPSWEVDKISRFSDAVEALFEDLTGYLAGDAAATNYPMLAAFPPGAWKHCVWANRLAAIPNPTDGPFSWVLFHRRDLFEEAGLTMPASIDELRQIAEEVTDPDASVWAFNDIFPMVQMFYKAPGSITGWRLAADGTPEHKYETEEYRAAVETMASYYEAGLIHPDLVASAGGDAKQLFRSGNIMFLMDGMGAWGGMQGEEQQVNPDFNMQPIPLFSATGGDPLAWGDDAPVNYVFIKKGLGKERVEEILRVINWCSAPFGTEEFQLRDLGVAEEHHTVADGYPTKTDLGYEEIGDQYFFISGRAPVVGPSPEVPTYVPDLLNYSNAMVQYLEENPWAGIKVEFPAQYSAQLVPIEDQVTDILRGRRPLTDLDRVVQEWRNSGGDQAREVLGQALDAAGR
jgi:putative aldouronate transport system substrate-binding protein